MRDVMPSYLSVCVCVCVCVCVRKGQSLIVYWLLLTFILLLLYINLGDSDWTWTVSVKHLFLAGTNVHNIFSYLPLHSTLSTSITSYIFVNH